MNLLQIADLLIAFLAHVQNVAEIHVISALAPSLTDRDDHIGYDVLLARKQPVHEDALGLVGPQPADILRVDYVLISPANTHHKFP